MTGEKIPDTDYEPSAGPGKPVTDEICQAYSDLCKLVASI